MDKSLHPNGLFTSCPPIGSTDQGYSANRLAIVCRLVEIGEFDLLDTQGLHDIVHGLADVPTDGVKFATYLRPPPSSRPKYSPGADEVAPWQRNARLHI